MWWPSVIRNPFPDGCIEYCTPVGMKKRGTGGCVDAGGEDCSDRDRRSEGDQRRQPAEHAARGVDDVEGPIEVGRQVVQVRSDEACLGEPQVIGQSAHLWTRTSLRPSDVDLALVYDGFTFNAVSWLEALGFCGIGEAKDFLDGGKNIARDGVVPVNPHGGQLSAGRTHGMGLVHEAVTQLRGEAGERQVEMRNGYALQHNAGGRGSGVRYAAAPARFREAKKLTMPRLAKPAVPAPRLTPMVKRPARTRTMDIFTPAPKSSSNSAALTRVAPAALPVILRGLRHRGLLVVRRKDRGAVLGAEVGSLAVERRGVVQAPEQLDQPLPLAALPAAAQKSRERGKRMTRTPANRPAVRLTLPFDDPSSTMMISPSLTT